MAIVLHSIEKLPEPGMFCLHLEVDARPISYRVYVDSDGSYTGIEEELFFLLSERALAEQGSAAVYHIDLGHLLRREIVGRTSELPFTFGEGRSRVRRPWWRWW